MTEYTVFLAGAVLRAALSADYGSPAVFVQAIIMGVLGSISVIAMIGLMRPRSGRAIRASANLLNDQRGE